MVTALARPGVRPALIGAVAAVAALIGVGRSSLWFDEAFSVRVAHLPVGRFVNTVLEAEPFNGLYYGLLKAWIRVAGDSPIAARMPSVVAAVVAVVATYLIGRRLLGERAAIIAAGFLAVHGLMLQYAQEVRAYALATALAAGATWLLLRAIERPSVMRWAAYGVAAVLAVYGHFFAAFVVAAHVVVLAVTPAWRPRPWLVAATYVAIGAAAAPLGWWLLNTTVSRGWMDPLGPQTATLVFRWFGAGSGITDIGLGWLLAACAAALAALALIVGGVRWARGAPDRHGWLLLLAWFVVPILAAVAISVLIRPVLAYRYLIVGLPAFALLVGGLLATASGNLSRLAVALPVVVVIGVGTAHAYLGPVRKPAWDEAARLVLADAEPGDGLVVWPNWQWVPLEYAFLHSDEPDAAPARVAVDPAVGDVDQILDDLAARSGRVWVLVWDGGERPDLEAFSYLDELEERYDLVRDTSVSSVGIALFEASD
jgi:mannosyltransferase